MAKTKTPQPETQAKETQQAAASQAPTETAQAQPQQPTPPPARQDFICEHEGLLSDGVRLVVRVREFITPRERSQTIARGSYTYGNMLITGLEFKNGSKGLFPGQPGNYKGQGEYRKFHSPISFIGRDKKIAFEFNEIAIEALYKAADICMQHEGCPDYIKQVRSQIEQQNQEAPDPFAGQAPAHGMWT